MDTRSLGLLPAPPLFGLVLIVVVAAMDVGCTLHSPEVSLTVETPPLPPAWEAAPWILEYQVSWLDLDGRRQRAVVPPGGRVGVELPRLSGAPVLVTPVVQTDRGERKLKPGGALYPRSLTDQRLEAAWIAGFEARLFLELGSFGYAYFQINQERLRRILRAETGDNPWRADYQRVRRALLAGSFRASYLAPRESRGWMVELPPGQYLSDLPTAAPLSTRPIAGRHFLVLEELYPGNHRFFYLGGAGEAPGELVVRWDGEHEPEWRFYRW